MYLYSGFLWNEDEPFIQIWRSSMDRLAKRLANHIVKPETLRSMKSITDFDLNG